MKKKWISATELCEKWGIEPLELYEIVSGSVERTNDPEKLKDRPDWVEQIYGFKRGRSVFSFMEGGEGSKRIVGYEVLNVGLQAYEKNGEPIKYHRLSGATKGNRGWHDSSTAIYIGDVLFLQEQVEEYFEKLKFQLSDGFYSKDFPKTIDAKKEAARAYLMKHLESLEIKDIADAIGKANSDESTIHRCIRQGRKVLIDILIRDEQAASILKQEIFDK